MAAQTTFGPLLGLKVLAVAAVGAAVLATRSEPPRGSELEQSADALLRRTARRWCEQHKADPRLQVASVEVRFLSANGNFGEGEGLVVTPVAVDVPGLQKVLDVEAYPPPLRKLPAEGILNLAWEYPGRSNRELRYLALALVERPKREAQDPPAAPTFAQMDASVREESLARAADLEEHKLHQCAGFSDWARRTAGEPPYTQQLLRLTRALAAQLAPESDDHDSPPANVPEDLCAAMRGGRLTLHAAQVLAVMAAREVGVPSFAFASASSRGLYLVGTYTDQAAWLFLDLEDAAAGYFSGGDALLTRLPLIGGFGASNESFWNPTGSAYTKTEWSGISAFSRTLWAGRLSPDHGPADTTTARTVPLAQVCP